MIAVARLQLLVARRQRATDLDLAGADLANLDLSALSADRLNCAGADLRGATLRRARLGACRLEHARLDGVDAPGAILRACVLDASSLVGAGFEGARIEDSSATGADCSRANLRASHLSETSFSRALLRDAVLDRAGGEGVEFRGADLTNASLVEARFDEADFRGADLRGATLSRGRFRSADFRGALLDGTIFDDADVSGAAFDPGASPLSASDAAEQAAESSADGAAAGPGPNLDAATLQQLLAQLPSLLGSGNGPSSDLLTRLSAASDSIGTAASQNPDEWRAWANRLVTPIARNGAADGKALEELVDSPIVAHVAQALSGDGDGGALLEQIRTAMSTLATAGDEPPDAWQPVIAALTDMIDGRRPVDLQALVDELATVGRRTVPSSEAKTRA
jgi:uncharacterized protein YjbI with pentapeptide repeats